MWRRAAITLSAVLVCASCHAASPVEEIDLPEKFSYPVAVASADGKVYYLAQNAHKLGVIDAASGKISGVGLPAGGSPAGITVDGNGTVWFTLSSKPANAIGSFSPDTGRISVHKVPTKAAEPYRIASGRDGSVWFTERNANKIGRFNGKGFREYPVTTPNSQPSGIAVDSKGGVWFTESVGNNIGRIDLARRKMEEYRIPTEYSAPSDIIVDGRDRVWFVEMNGNRLVMFDPGSAVFNEAIIPTANSVPASLASGADGTIWFTESRGSRVGSFNPETAVFDEFATPTPNSLPIGITVDREKRVWFTEAARDANKIGVINPGAKTSLSEGPPVKKEVHH